MRARERRGEPELFADEVEPLLLPDLERAQPVDVTAQPADRIERIVHRCEGEQRDDDVLGPRDEPEPGRRHDGQRALAAAEQPAQVVAGVVLLEPVEPFDDVAVRRARPARRPPGCASVRNGARGHRPRSSRCCRRPSRCRGPRGRRRTPNRPRAPGPAPRRASRRRPRSPAPARPSTGPSASRRRSDRTISPRNGTEPPTRPVLPPWGTTATRAASHVRTTRATSSTSRGRTTAGVRAPEASGPVGRVARGEIGIGDHVLRADGRSEIVEQLARTRRGWTPRAGYETGPRETGAWVRNRRRPCADAYSSQHHRSSIRTSTAPWSCARTRRRRLARLRAQPPERDRPRRRAPRLEGSGRRPRRRVRRRSVSPDAVIALARGGAGGAGWVPVLDELGTIDLGGDPTLVAADLTRCACSSATRAGRRASSKTSSTSSAWFVVDAHASGSVRDRPRCALARGPAPPARPHRDVRHRARRTRASTDLAAWHA